MDILQKVCLVQTILAFSNLDISKDSERLFLFCIVGILSSILSLQGAKKSPYLSKMSMKY